MFPIDLGCNLKSFSTQHSGQQLWIDLNHWKYDTNFSVRGISEREKKGVYSVGREKLRKGRENEGNILLQESRDKVPSVQKETG